MDSIIIIIIIIIIIRPLVTIRMITMNVTIWRLKLFYLIQSVAGGSAILWENFP